VLCAAAMTHAYDWGRIIFLAAAVFFVASGHLLSGRRRSATAVVVPRLATDLGYAIYLQAHGIAQARIRPRSIFLSTNRDARSLL
jgi:hypothetical protein